MKRTHALCWLFLLAPLTSCTKSVRIDVAFEDGLPVLTFRDDRWFSHSLKSVCLWNAEIIDDASGRVAMGLRAIHSDSDCSPVSRVSFGLPGKNLKWMRGSSALIKGRSYHAEAITEVV